MRNKIFNLLVIFSFIIILLEIIINKTLVFDTISYALEVWVKNIIPSLAPFFIVSDVLINYNITSYIPKFLKNTFKYLFNVSEYGISIFFLSMISGFPSNARNTCNYYKKGLITLEEANHILIFTHFSNPLFILSTVSVLFFNNEKIGLPILISHYLGNVILGVLSRNYTSSNIFINYTRMNKKSQNFGLVLTNSIKSSIDTLFLILGTLSCFLVLSSLIIDFFNFDLYTSVIVKCILEITMGINSLSLLNISDLYIVCICAMAISFGGLSVHMQIISQISDTDISYFPFFVGRCLHSIISLPLAIFFYLIML